LRRASGAATDARNDDFTERRDCAGFAITDEDAIGENRAVTLPPMDCWLTRQPLEPMQSWDELVLEVIMAAEAPNVDKPKRPAKIRNFIFLSKYYGICPAALRKLKALRFGL
jgi:hypothetical protein